jgi:hypothetical protein
MIAFYKPLPLKLTLNGFWYTQLFRTDYEAIYVQKINENVVFYEVFIIKRIPEKIIMGKVIAPHEKFPKNEDFGYSAWTIAKLDSAVNKFFELYNKRKKKL